MDDDAAKRLEMDVDKCLQHRDLILEHIDDFAAKTSAIFSQSDFPVNNDPDTQLYSGGFFNREDSARIDTIRNTPVKELAELHFNFDDPRLEEMLFRYRARNHPETLNDNEREQWQAYREEKLENPAVSHRTLNQFMAEIETIQQAPDTIGRQLALLEELLDYANTIKMQ